MTQLKRLASCDIDNPVTCRPETSNRRRRWWYAGALGRLLAMLAAACTLIAPVSAIAQTCDGALTWTGIAPDCLVGGTSYRILFVTGGSRDPTSSDIAVYNTFVQGQADAATGDPFDGITFNVLGSTVAVDARDNTDTHPTDDGPGEQIFYYRGRKVADNYADLYDGTWDTTESRNENGATFAGVTDAAWTGTDNDGTELVQIGTTRALGNGGAVVRGAPRTAGRQFVQQTDSTTSTSRSFYALSNVITSPISDTTVPAFDPAASIPGQVYVVTRAITGLTLPEATGGDGALTYTITPTLPTGLTLTGRILTGTPDTEQDPVTYTYTANDSDTNTAATDTDTLTFTIEILDASFTPMFSSTANIPAQTYTEGIDIGAVTLPQGYGGSLFAAGVVYSITPTLPNGLTLTGRILTGAPAAGTVQTATSYSYVVDDTDEFVGGTDASILPFTIRIAGPPVNICDRTPQVRDTILTASADSDCTAVTDLAVITTLDLRAQSITALQSGDFAGLSALGQLNLFNNNLDTLPLDIFAGLTTVDELFINRNNFASLPVGIFDGLMALANLALHDNPFTPGTGLPAGIFDDVLDTLGPVATGGSVGLAVDATGRAAHFVCSRDDAATIVAITAGVTNCLRITAAQLTAFPMIDTSLSALTISAGALTPAFDPATDAYTVAVQNSVESVTVTPTANQPAATITVQTVAVNSGSASAALPLVADTPLPVAIEVTAPDGTTVGTYTVTVTRPATGGASAALTGTITEANLSAGAAMATVTLTGATFVETGLDPADFSISDNIDGDLSIAGVTLTGSTTTTATVRLTHSGEDITANGALSITLLASGYAGSVNLAAGSLAITASTGTNICGRTRQVRDEIIEESTATECTSVTDLATITTISLISSSIDSLQSGDFAGLDLLDTLTLSNNALTTLPADLFAGLSALESLFLGSNSLASLPAGIFNDLDALVTLVLNTNQLTTLDADLFAGLPALQTLRLEDNQFTADTGLPAGIFDDVLDTLGPIRTTIPSTGSAFVIDGAVRNAHFICSRADADVDAIVAFTTGITDCLRITTAQLTAFTNADARLSALTLSSGELRPSFDPAITAYNVAVADSVATVTVTPTANQGAATISVNGATVASGAASAAITLTSGTAVPATIVVTAGDGSTERTYTVMVTRGAAAATLAGTLTEANLYSTTAPTVTVTLERTEFVDTADLSGADFTVSHTLAGTLSLSNIARDSATVATLTLGYDNVDITADGVISVTVLASGHTGSVNLLTNTLPVTASDGVNVCGRTAQVQAEIIRQSSASECTNITDLATITILDLRGDGITTLQSGDFAGLSTLGQLNLFNNNLDETLPLNIFAGLTTVDELFINTNNFASLPVGIFDGLTALANLALANNPFTPGTGLPAGIFDDVIDTLGPVATGGGVGLAVDAVGRAAHFVCSLPQVSLIEAANGDTNCLRITSAQLDEFIQTDTSLSALTISAGILTPAFDPTTDAYTVAVQNSVASVTVTPTANRSGATITVEGTPVTSGAASTALTLVAGTPLVVDIEITATDGTTTGAYTVTVSRPATGGPSAALSGTITEANLFAGTAMATMTLTDTNFVSSVAPADFSLSHDIDGDLSIAGVTLATGSTTTATVMLTHSGGDITANGALSIELLASGHTGSDNLAAGSLAITASAGEYICGRTSQVRDTITTASADADCTGITDLATIAALDLSNQGITRLQDGDLDGLNALATLALAGNPFTAGGLPAGIFDGVLNTLGDVGTAFTVDNAVRQAHFICSRADAGAIVSATAGVNDCLQVTEAQLAAFPDIDASLQALTLSVGDLMPDFDPATTAYNVGVAANVESVTVTPTANQSGAAISVNGATVASGSASVAVPLVANTPATITIQVTATDTSTTRDYVVMVTRGGASATLATSNPLTEARLFSDLANRVVQVDLARTEFVVAADLSRDDFTVSDTLDGTVGLANVAVTRLSATQALMTLEYTGNDITANGVISVTVLESAHTGSGDLLTNTLPITASTGANVCGRTAQVRDEIVNRSSATECTSITDLASITFLDLNGPDIATPIASLQPGDFAGLSALERLRLPRNNLSALPPTIFAGLTSLEFLTLGLNELEALPATIFAGLTSLRQLNLDGNSLSTLPATIFAGLTSLQGVRLDSNDLEALPATIFDGLDIFNSLFLHDNSFTAGTGLPAGIFDDVLDTLGPIVTTASPFSEGDQVIAIDQRVRDAHFVCSRPDFAAIVTATTGVNDCLRITAEQLSAFQMTDTTLSALSISSGDMLVPDFAPGVTAYTVGVLNRFESITVTATASQPTATITVTVEGSPVTDPIPLTAGTPVDIVIVVTAPDGTTAETVTVTATREGAPAAVLAGTLTEANLFAATAPTVTVTLTGTDYVEAGELMPDDFTVTDMLPDGTVSITEVARTSNRIATLTLGYDRVDIPDAGGMLSLMVRETGHSDSGDLDAGNIDITASTGTNVCGRTAQVRDEIISESTATECTSITDLASITFLDLNGPDIATPIASLQPGDFAGLSALERLRLPRNNLSALPATIFAGLSALETLTLGLNPLEALPDDIFDGLTSLQTLNLDNNALTTLPATIFSGLSALVNLRLDNPIPDALPDLEALPATIFSDLTSLQQLNLNDNDLEALPATIFDGLTALENLALHNNPFTAGTGLPAGIFDDVIDTLVAVGDGDLNVDDTGRAAHFICSRDDFAAIVADAGVTDCLLVSSAQLTAFIAADATLSALSLSDGILDPAFDPGTIVYTATVQNSVASVTVTPTARQSGATITVQTVAVTSGSASTALALTAGTPLDINIVVTATDGTTTGDYTVTVTRPDASAPAAALAGTLTEADLFATTTPTVTVTLTGTEFVDSADLMADDFAVTDTIDGTVSVTGVTRTSVTEASLALGYDAVDFSADGSLSVAVLAAGHTGAVNLSAGSLDITASTGTNVCGRTAAVRDAIVALSAAGECTSVADLATIAGPLDLSGAGITALQPGDLAELAALTVLDLSGNALVTLPADLLDTLTALQVLSLAGNSLNALAATVFADLSLLQELDLSGNRLSTLDAAQFGGLTALRILDLSGNTLSALDAGVFQGLNALATLSLAGNTFTAGTGLPSGVFDDVLDTLLTIGAGPTGFIVDENVRAGHFVCSRPEAGLIVAGTSTVSDCLRITAAQLADFAMRDASLMALTLSDGALVPAFAPTITSYSASVADDVDTVTVTPTATQAAATITVNGTPVNSGEASTAITLTTGTPVAVTVVVTATDGTTTTTYAMMVTRGGATATLAGTVNEANLYSATAPTVTVTLARSEYVDAADLTADDFTLTDSIDGTVSIAGVERTSAMVATLTLAYDNVDVTDNGELFLTVLAAGHTGSVSLSSRSLPIAQSAGANVCGRTAEVVAGIVAASSASECTSVGDLATITTVDLRGDGITALQSGDFAGLAGLTDLLFNDNGLTTLPPDIFAGLSALEQLNLFNNNLDILPDGVFAGLTSVDELFINRNNFASLPVGIFDGLMALENLALHDNPFTPGAGLPAGIFDDVLDTLGPVATGGSVGLAVDATGRAAHFVCSRDDAATIVAATAGVTNCLRITSAQLDTFIQTDTGLSALTISDGALSPAFDPATADYNVAVLNIIENVTVTPTARQSGATIAVQTVAVTSGSATAPLPLVAGTPLAIDIVVTAPDGSTMGTYTVTVSRPAAGGPTATLAGTLTEANLFAGAATATVTLMSTEYVAGLSADDFTLSADVPGTVSLSSVARTSTTVATLTLSHSGGDITANGELMMNLLASGHTGLAALATNGLVITASAGTNVCDRTPAVRDAIVAVSTATVCADVTDLATITSLDLSGGAVTTLQGDDFAGMTGLTTLVVTGDISNPLNRLSALPPDIFAGLTSLTTLSLDSNSLSTLPPNIFASLTSLTDLRLGTNQFSTFDAALIAGLTNLERFNLNGNGLTTLSPTIFTSLTSLTDLRLDGNDLATLDAGQFAGLDLETLGLLGNSFTAGTGLPAGIFDDVLDTLGAIGTEQSSDFAVDDNVRAAHFVCGRDDADDIVAATAGVDDCLRITVAQLTAFTNADASLTALTLSDGDLAPAFDPAITAYNVAVANNVATVMVTPTASQSAATISVNNATVDSGAASAAISLTSGTAVPVTVVVTAGDGSTVRTYTLMVTRGGATATLAGTVNEANLFSTTAPTVTVTVVRSELVAAGTLVAGNFMLSDTVDGTVSVSSVDRTSATEATLTLAYDNMDITANGTLSVTVLAAGHTGSGNLPSNTIPITASTGTNICGRTAEVVAGIVAASSASECTSVGDLATITTVDLRGDGITALQSGDFAGLSALGQLNLFNNNLDTLPLDIFAGLTTVDELFINRNNFASLPVGIFDGLTALANLALHDNPFTPGTGLPAGIFDDVLDTLGPVATGGSVGLAVDATGRAAHFICSSPLADLIVAATASADNCLWVTSAQLDEFMQIDTSLSALTISDGVLTPAFDPVTDAYNVTVQNSVENVTVTPTANQSGATITVQTVAVTSGSASAELALAEGASLDIVIVVTATDGSTTGTYTLTVSRPAAGGATATLTGTLTEANLFAGTAMATLTLSGTEYETGVAAADFLLSADVAGTVSLSGVDLGSTPTSTVVVMLPLSHSGEDISADGELMMTLLASGHTGTVPLATNGLAITASAGTNICDRTAQVRDTILAASTASECTNVEDLATIRNLSLVSMNVATLQSGDLAGLTGLVDLNFGRNDLSTLPDGIFDALAALETLNLSENQLEELPPGIFDALDSLFTFRLEVNMFTPGTGLPAGIFDEILDTVTSIPGTTAPGQPAASPFTVDDNTRAAHFVCSRPDFAAIVTATDGVEDCLRITVAQLTTFRSNATLSALTISGGGTLVPAFNPSTTTYTVSVANSVDSVTVTPTAVSSAAMISVNGATVTSGSASEAIALTVGTAVAVNVVVTAEDGTMRTYTASVTRMPAGPMATLAASTPLTEANLSGSTVTVTLADTEYVDPLLSSHFMLVEDVEGDVTVASVLRTSNVVATLTLAHSGEDISANGALSMTLLAAGHTGSDPLPAGTVPITATGPVDPAPTVTGIAITSTGPYALDEEIEVTVTFSENVTVAGVPEIALMVGANARQATFASGSASADLVFTYTVVAGETDANGVSINADALSLPAGVTIQNSGGDAAILTHTITVAEVPANAVDTTAPLFSGAAVNVNVLVLTYAEDLDMSSTPANGDYTIGLSSGTPPTVSGVTINGAEVTLALSAAVGSGLTATVSYTPGSTPLRDIAGNNAVALTAASVTNNTPSGPAASLTASPPLTEANLSGATVTVTLVNTQYEDPLAVDDFTLTDTVAGDVTVASVLRSSTTVATVTLAHTGEAFSGDGTLSVTVLAAGHTGAGNLMTNTVPITATPAGPNSAPVAVIAEGATLAVNAGASVTLNSTGSNDPDSGDMLTYAWRVVIDGVPALTLATTNLATLSFTAPAVMTADEYTIGLVVNDGTLDSPEAMIVVTVSPAGPVTPATPGPTPEQTEQLHDEIAPQALQTIAGNVTASVGARIETAIQGVPGGGVRLDGQGIEGDGEAVLLNFLEKAPEYTRSIQEGSLNWKRMLANSSFSLNVAGDGYAGGGLGVWGSGHYTEFNGDDNDLDWDGDSYGFQVGADTHLRNDLLTGIAFSWSEGDVEYSMGNGADAEQGDYILTLTGIHPYLGWSSGDGRMSLWASAGYADGKIEIEPDAGVDREHDTTVVSLAGGFTRNLTDFLRIKGDFSGLEADIDEADEVPNDSDFSTESQRLRLLLEGRHQQRLPGGGTLSQSAEVGYRVDEGDSDADTDGTEVGGSVDYHNPATGFSVSGKIRALVGNSDYQEWGVSGLIRLESDAQGLSFTLEPGYGDTAGSAGELWQRKTPYLETERQSYGARMKMHLGYGLHGGIMPYTELTSGEALRSFRMGVKWQLGKALDLNLFGEQYEADESDNSLQLEGKLEF